MSVGINVNLMRSTQYNPLNNNLQENQARSNNAASSDNAEKKLTSRALEHQQRQQQKSRSVIDQSISYAEQMKASRAKAKEADNQKKKLQYSYKKLSSQIVRSKTSISAKRAVSAARREVQRLKRLQNSGDYDEEELQISIEHAKSMERVARKKASHLAQEEMIERAHNGAFAALEEKEEEIQDKEDPNEAEEPVSEEELATLEQEEAFEEYNTAEFSREQEILLKEVTDDMILRMEEMTREQEIALKDSTEELNEEMMSMAQDAMEEVLDLSELASTMTAPNPNMSDEDLKMLRIKHRTREMKEIAEADNDYLKAIFDKHQKDMAKSGASASGAASNSAATSPSSPVSAAGGSSAPSPITVTIPGGYGSAGGSMSFEAFV